MTTQVRVRRRRGKNIQPKSSVWSPQASAAEVRPGTQQVVGSPLQQVPRVIDEGIILLGAPLGSEAFVKEAIKSKVSKVEEISALLPLLEDPFEKLLGPP